MGPWEREKVQYCEPRACPVREGPPSETGPGEPEPTPEP
jgi:hypothetical protein